MGRLRTLPDALAEAARTDAGYVFVSGGTDTLPLVRRDPRGVA